MQFFNMYSKNIVESTSTGISGENNDDYGLNRAYGGFLSPLFLRAVLLLVVVGVLP